jgi:hypothetical protein
MPLQIETRAYGDLGAGSRLGAIGGIQTRSRPIADEFLMPSLVQIGHFRDADGFPRYIVWQVG